MNKNTTMYAGIAGRPQHLGQPMVRAHARRTAKGDVHCTHKHTHLHTMVRAHARQTTKGDAIPPRRQYIYLSMCVYVCACIRTYIQVTQSHLDAIDDYEARLQQVKDEAQGKTDDVTQELRTTKLNLSDTSSELDRYKQEA